MELARWIIARASALALASAWAMLLPSCGAGHNASGLGLGNTYCQGGPKYGTSCYAMSDVRQPPGQRPPLSSEPPNWWQPAPPGVLGSSGSSAKSGAPVPMSSPAWRPSSTILDAGATSVTHTPDAGFASAPD